ncbi:MAG TPA: hypothetical protein VMA73_12150 [Streptosporangiaceae bacterium]|nr:hypothetical protein [Streptosporangiaceae bacterium]
MDGDAPLRPVGLGGGWPGDGVPLGSRRLGGGLSGWVAAGRPPGGGVPLGSRRLGGGLACGSARSG